MSDVIEVRVTIAADNAEPVALLCQATSLPAGRIKHAMACGCVWHTNARRTTRVRRADRRLAPGDTLDLYYDPRVLATQPPAATLLADLRDYSVWHKPAGMWSQGTRWGDHCSLPRAAEVALGRTAFVVHRLDRATSGIMLVAHNRRTAAALAERFRTRQIDKRYLAVVETPSSPSADVDACTTPVDGRSAATEWRALDFDAVRARALLDVRPHTGRKHQIRLHLAAAGLPIVGDRLHGTAATGDEDLRLQAWRLAFRCPVRDVDAVFELDPARRLSLAPDDDRAKPAGAMPTSRP